MEFWCCSCKSMRAKDDFSPAYQKPKMNTGRRCRSCASAYQKQRRLQNPERHKGHAQKAYLNNKAKNLARMKAWVEKNPDKRREILQKSKVRERQIISDSYVATTLRAKVGYLPKELIETKRIQILIYRHIKEKK